MALKLKIHTTPLFTEALLAVPMAVTPAITLLPAEVSSQMPVPPGLAVERLKLSVDSALLVICIFNKPPFQLASPSGSLTTIALTTDTEVCSIYDVSGLCGMSVSTDTVLLPAFETIKSALPSPLTSALVTEEGLVPVK